MTPVENYLALLEKITGSKAEFFGNKSEVPGMPGVVSIVYRDFPEKGYLTGFTYGLSLVEHPEWKLARPELVLSVKSEDLSWGQVTGYIANQLRGKAPFGYGNTIDFAEKISDESEMDAFLVFPPAAVPTNSFLNLDIGTSYRINLNGLYPIYKSEIEVYNQLGPDEFWKHEGFDVYNVKREPIQLLVP